MLAQSEGHRDRVETLVQRWLQERQQLIVQMMALSDERKRMADPIPLAERVGAFCQVLMDYVSAGHFEVFDQLLAEAEKRDSDHLVASQALIRRLQPTTDAVIRFNDVYEDPRDEEALAGLSHELSMLGLELARRFEIEDGMIALLHDSAGKTAA